MNRQTQFLELFLKHQAEILGFIRTLVRDHESANDIFQEVALTLWKTFDRYDPQRSFPAWARGIAANWVKRHWRNLKRGPQAVSPEVIQQIVDAYARTDDDGDWRPALKDCLKHLPQHSRDLIHKRYKERMPLQSIADLVDNSLAATQKTLSRIRIGLRKCIEQRIAEQDMP